MGRALLSEIVPSEIPFSAYNKVLGKKDLAELIDLCYRLTGNKKTVLLADALMQTGFRNAMRAGISISVHDMQMPPEKKLSDEQIAALKTWVSMGAPDPRERTATAWRPNADHWSFKPVANPSLPAVKDTAWPRNEIDRFVLARLEREGLRPAPEADPISLCRRLYFDLIGLPPTPEEVA